MTIRIAAVADVHFGTDSAGTLRPHLEGIAQRADVLLVAGDLTQIGAPEEAEVLARELADCEVPVIAILGNHDYHSECEDQIRKVLESCGVTVLEGEAVSLRVNGHTL